MKKNIKILIILALLLVAFVGYKLSQQQFIVKDGEVLEESKIWDN